MTSTYSPALRLELMATGDQSGTWGDTTNTNLGTLLEQAITGYLSVAQGDVANLTLTTVNGGTDQARNAVVRITGALTATRNVVVQTAAKLYTIANDTTGGFSIVVKTAAGTGVSIPPGAMANVYSNGTNVIQGANYWTGQIGGATWLDAGATFGPEFDAFRDSTSPAVSDVNARYTFSARSSTGVKRRMAYIEQSTIDPTNASEDASLDFYVMRAGTPTLAMSIGAANTGPFSVVRRQTFAASGTYTPHANMVYCLIECVGGGGAGGSVQAGSNAFGGAGGGGAGGYSSKIASAATIGASQTVTIGAAGTAGAAGNNAGGNGGDTSVGAICIAKGGTGGSGANTAQGQGGAGGIAGTGDVTGTGQSGGGNYGGSGTTVVFGTGGQGGSGPWGGGGVSPVAFNTAATGNAGTGKGAGGSGAGCHNSTSTAQGGVGTIGFAIVTEFCSA